MSLADKNGGGRNIRPRLFKTFVMSNFNLLALQVRQLTKRTRNDRKAKK